VSVTSIGSCVSQEEPVSIDIGQSAPDFELPDQNRSPVRLSDFRGRSSVLLVFYPMTFTPICHGELCAIGERLDTFAGRDVEVLAISCDAGPSQARWAQEQQADFTLLSDFWPHGEVSRAYGVLNEDLGVPNRATFLIDINGVVVDRFESPGIGTAREIERYDKALDQLASD
jgi:mycoredoxin-dependent peroxiredoxin